MFEDRRDAGEQLARRLEAYRDRDVVVLEQPQYFRAVAQVYERWYDVPDTEVAGIMERWRREHGGEG
ncbi:MAG: hypothetical protein ACOC7N_03440 [Chloroflexota bacterium]